MGKEALKEKKRRSNKTQHLHVTKVPSKRRTRHDIVHLRVSWTWLLFNLHDRRTCTSIKKIIELFATVAREGRHFRGWEALAIRRKIIFAAFRSPFECNMDSFVFFFFFFFLVLFLCLVSCQEAETRVKVSLATSKGIFSAILFSSRSFLSIVHGVLGCFERKRRRAPNPVRRKRFASSSFNGERSLRGKKKPLRRGPGATQLLSICLDFSQRERWISFRLTSRFISAQACSEKIVLSIWFARCYELAVFVRALFKDLAKQRVLYLLLRYDMMFSTNFQYSRVWDLFIYNKWIEQTLVKQETMIV